MPHNNKQEECCRRCAGIFLISGSEMDTCPCHQPPKQGEEWEKELDDIFAIRVDEKVEGKIYKDRDYGDFFGDRKELKEFIRSLLRKGREDVVKQVEALNIDEMMAEEVKLAVLEIMRKK